MIGYYVNTFFNLFFRGVQIKCTLWDAYDQCQGVLHNDNVVIIIRFAKIMDYMCILL